MKNALLFFYNININDINKINNNYYFNYQNNNFIVTQYNRDIKEIKELYTLQVEMINNNIPVYQIINTKDNSFLFEFENKKYILMIIPKIKNRIVTFEDIINFNYVPINNYSYIDKSNWNIAWSNKIDYFEYQFNQIKNKYKTINSSINYYIGLWENAISYYNDNIKATIEVKFVCHKRLCFDTDLLYFLNPLNFVIDNKERDIADYIKSYVLNEKYSKEKLEGYLSIIPINYNSITRFISRSLFPSNYFDLYENIVYNMAKEEQIIDIINNKKTYIEFLNLTFTYFRKYNIPEISWIIKKD